MCVFSHSEQIVVSLLSNLKVKTLQQ